MTRWDLPAVAPNDVVGWESRLRGLAAAYRDLAAAGRRAAAAEHLAAQQRGDRDREQARRNAAAQQDQVRRALSDATRAARAIALRRFGRLAGGLAGAEYTAPLWRSPEWLGAAAPLHVRVGTLVEAAGVPTGATVPVAVPLLSTAGWAIEADAGAAAGLILGTVLRVVAATPPFGVRVDWYDPGLTGLLGAFGSLYKHTDEIVTESITRPEPLAARLTELVDAVSRRGARLAELGAGTFAELLANGGPIPEPYRLMVLLHYPAGIDARAQRELVRVVRSAPERGVCLLVHHDPLVLPEREVDPAELLDELCRFTARHDRWEIADLDISCRRDPGPDLRLCQAVSDLVGQAADRAALPLVSASQMLPPEGEWLRRVGSGRSAELCVDIGVAGRSPATIRLSSADPPMPNILVGGAVGQGKSNLLHVLIHGLAARYSPEDLQMYLLDFKQGLEFTILGPGRDRPHWLPHVRVLGVYADREFGLEVLRHIDGELVNRGALFKRLGNVADIAALPPDNPYRPPRLLLALDEFQVLLADDDDIADEAAALLEKLVRLGRAFGLHVVLATQTLEGVPRLATRRDSIFGQVPYRLILKSAAADSQAMLQVRNTAAAGLRFRGQAILNDNFGAPEANREILVAYADQRQLDELRQRLWQRAAAAPPRIFEVDAAADLVPAIVAAAGPPADGGEVRQAWVGLPLSVDENPVSIEVRPEPGAGLLVLGDDATTALGVLGGVALSLAYAAPGCDDRFVVLDLLPDQADVAGGRDAMLAALRGLDHPVEAVDRSGVPDRLLALRDMVRTRVGNEPPVHLVALGMHRAVRLTTPTGETLESPADALREIATDGAGVGVFLYGWWNRLKSCRDHLGYTPPIDTYLFLRHPVDGVKEVCGSFVRWWGRPCRGLLHDAVSAEPRQVVTFQPLTDVDVASLAAHAAARRERGAG
jgi:hypothetical protein